MNTYNNISQELLENIERYLNNTMSQQERDAFEKLIHENEDLKAQFEEVKTIILGIETQTLKEQLNDFHSDLESHETVKQNTKVRRLSFQKIAIAASIIIALGLFWIFAETPNQKLYADFFVPDPGLPTTMSSTNNYTFFDAMVNYKQGDYKTAIEKWKVLEKKSASNDTLTYFLGVANLANGHTENAISYLEKTKDFNASVFKNDTYYYLGLAYLKNNQVEKAISHLKMSTAENSQKLLNKLK